MASGLIEGTARWLIKDRMEVTGDLDDYLDFHFQQEKQHSVPYLSAK